MHLPSHNSWAWTLREGLASDEEGVTSVCGMTACSPRLSQSEAITATPSVTAAEVLRHIQHGPREGKKVVLLDVRPPLQYGLSALTGSVNIPLVSIERDILGTCAMLGVAVKQQCDHECDSTSTCDAPPEADCSNREAETEVFVICRRGIDSEVATKVRLSSLAICVSLVLTFAFLLQALRLRGITAFNMTGGLEALAALLRDTDGSHLFPMY